MSSPLLNAVVLRETLRFCGFYQYEKLLKLDQFPLIQELAYQWFKRNAELDLRDATFEDLLDYLNNVSDTIDGECHSYIVWRQFDVSDYCRKHEKLLHHESMREIRKQGCERMGEALFITFFHTRYRFVKQLSLEVLLSRLPFIANSISRMENLEKLSLQLYLGNAVHGKRERFMPAVPRRGEHYAKVTFSNVRDFSCRWRGPSRKWILDPTTADIDDVKVAFPNLTKLRLDDVIITHPFPRFAAEEEHIYYGRVFDHAWTSAAITLVYVSPPLDDEECFNHPDRSG